MEKIKFIVGRHYGGGSHYWIVPSDSYFHEHIKVGNYAIVERGGRFTMVEIISTGETSKEYANLLTGDSFGIKNRVLMIFSEEGLRELQGDQINS